jgi:hypothetical protein
MPLKRVKAKQPQSKAEHVVSIEPVKHPGSKHYYNYNIHFDGQLIVEDSTDATCGACRALKAKGLRGSVLFLDHVTRKPRYSVRNLEKMALLSCVDGERRLHFRKFQARPPGDLRGHKRTPHNQGTRPRKAPTHRPRAA